MSKPVWVVASTNMYDETGRLLGIARHEGEWSAQGYDGAINFVQHGQAREHTLEAAQRACVRFLARNAKQRKMYDKAWKRRMGRLTVVR
jgi:ribosomal protein L27